MIGIGMVVLGLFAMAPMGGEDQKVVTEATIDAPVAVVWRAFTTAEGLKGWNVAHATVDLRIGGKMTTHYDPKGKLGDPNTIENTFLSYEPMRMLSIRSTKAPETFPFKNAIKNTWTIIYFDEATPDKTRLRIVGQGYGEDAESQQMKTFFKNGNGMLVKKLETYCKSAK